MRTLLLIFLSIIITTKSYCQKNTVNRGPITVEIIKEKRPKRIYAKVEVDSTFKRVDSTWAKTIEKNLIQNLSDKKEIKAGKYVIGIRFIVMKDGTMADIVCENDPGFGLAAEVITVIKKSAKWKPAEGSIVTEPRK